MKIDVELSPKSVKEAIKAIKKQRAVLTDKAIPEFMQLAADWIINRANEILDRSDIGEEVKSAIFRAWDTQWVGVNHLKVINHSWHSAYVEFGVGVIGGVFDHPNASKTNWQYNVPTEHKDSQGGWSFIINDEDKLDIPEDRILERLVSVDGKIRIYTRGTQGVWYLFNAVEDFKINYQHKLWEKIKKKYWS